MNMTGRRYIAYGSNLNRGQMALRCPDAKVVGTGEIKEIWKTQDEYRNKTEEQ